MRYAMRANRSLPPYLGMVQKSMPNDFLCKNPLVYFARSVSNSPDASGVGPVASHAGAREERRHRLVKEEMVGDQLILVLLRHGGQWVVLALELTAETGQSVHHHLLDL